MIKGETNLQALNSNLKPQTSALALLLLIFALAGCGGDNNNAPAPTPTLGAAATPVAASFTPSAVGCAQAISSLAAVKSFHFVYTDTQTISASGFGAGKSGTSSASGTFSAEGDANLAARAWHYSASDTRAERSDIVGEWIHVSAKAYHKEGGGWATPPSADALPIDLNSKLNQFSASPPSASQIELLGVEDVAGQPRAHCQFATDAQAGGEATTYDLWVSNSGQVMRFLATRQSESYSLTLSQLDQPVNIAAPPS